MSSQEWLGKSNGEIILFDLLKQDITKEQARACVTTFCILFNIEVDTNEWDELIFDIYKHYNNWFDTKEDLDLYMCKLLV